ncbi:MAG TPA: energy transducer TonB [Usitatibacteraceae bacterium]|nr:energy transducer TonB [Usitatibacteraceae bacterium]
MHLRQTPPDALVHFSDYLLERFGLVASMQVAFVASVAFHAFAIVGLGFRVPDPRGFDAPHNVLDVVLVNAKSASKPAKADALAQANLDGGGNTDKKRRASSPFPVMDSSESAREVRQAQGRVQQLEREAAELMTRLKSKAAVAPPDPVADRDEKSDKTARDLIEKSLEIQRLEAQIRRDFQAYQERPRKKFVGARASEYRFAMYVDNWRLKIERVGNLNYPDEARRQKLYGSLQLTVGLKPDGDVESVEINRSSGHRVLDQAAIRIVRLASPFDRFPDVIRADTDILYITRTWTFTRADQISAE